MLWSLPSGVLTCCSAGGRGAGRPVKHGLNLLVEEYSYPYCPFYLNSHNMKLELPKSNCQSSVICRQSSVVSFVSSAIERVIWIHSFLANKPNSPNVQMNTSFFITMNYTIFTSLMKVKNKPNQSQNKANSKPINPLHKNRDLLHSKGICVIGRFSHYWQNQTERW